ncbi:hypothetical protein VB773_12020 [Haloarculaceae archaeon H-GB2-1]|nr:hypothetical protein [Haloarculaceae archaeon H-GB1-1]MEA5386686.1 hypothetical protein [Haloarculaceae archaeon H-GB11]MEA5408212.1 hypothetical protein [Haloarculaceae archaeon H-GB2-1]
MGPARPTLDSSDSSPTASPPDERVVDQLRASAERIRERQLETALSRHDRCGGVREDQQRVVDALSHALVTAVLQAPTDALADADEPTRRRATVLFELDE